VQDAVAAYPGFHHHSVHVRSSSLLAMLPMWTSVHVVHYDAAGLGVNGRPGRHPPRAPRLDTIPFASIIRRPYVASLMALFPEAPL